MVRQLLPWRWWIEMCVQLDGGRCCSGRCVPERYVCTVSAACSLRCGPQQLNWPRKYCDLCVCVSSVPADSNRLSQQQLFAHVVMLFFVAKCPQTFFRLHGTLIICDSLIFTRWRQCSPPFTACLFFLGPTRDHIPNSISIGSAVFAQLTAESPYIL